MNGEAMDIDAITNALRDLESARSNYEGAAVAESEARRRATAALNELNEAQKRFDAMIAQVRDKHPHNSDWRRPTQRGVSAA